MKEKEKISGGETEKILKIKFFGFFFWFFGFSWRLPCHDACFVYFCPVWAVRNHGVISLVLLINLFFVFCAEATKRSDGSNERSNERSSDRTKPLQAPL